MQSIAAGMHLNLLLLGSHSADEGVVGWREMEMLLISLCYIGCEWLSVKNYFKGNHNAIHN